VAITTEESTETRTVSLTIDGRAVTAPEGATIWQAARDAGIDIPVLCHDERYEPVGVCRVCVVDVGARVYAAACVRPCEDGMEVKTATPDLERHRAQLTELLLVDQPPVPEDPKETTTADNELLVLVRRYGLEQDDAQIPRGQGRGEDMSNPVIAVNHDACILCDRCIRACDDVQGNDVIGRVGKGYETRIAFDLDDPMGESSCVTCGECVAACPTGAIINKPINNVPIRPRDELRQVDTVCPYCGVGCALTFHVDDERQAIAYADGRPQPGSHSRLCVKGRYGWDYSFSEQRLTTPLIRRESSYPKGPLSHEVRGDERRRGKPGGLVDYGEVMPHFREATWDEALDLVASRLKAIHAESGPSSIAGFGSAKCSNEEAYLFQKLIRAGFQTNNIDHCTRLCHASSVAALFEGVGSGAVSTTYGDIINADVAILAGTNTTANHPVASSFFKQARRRGTKLIVVDPRRERIADHADVFCQIKPGTDVAFYNGVMHEVIRLGLVDREFIASRTSNYGELAKVVREYTPERAEQITGVDADTIRLVGRLWGEAGAGIIYWGMGVSQHTTGTDNSRCLISLCAITGNVGRPGTGLHPLRGQNNVQGASDVGLIPMVFPDYQPVGDAGVREKFEALWGTMLDPNPGLTVVEIMNAVHAGTIRGMYIMGENPAMSDPDVAHARAALAELEMLVVQDIFLTETCYLADVILPASAFPEKTGTFTNTDRSVQLGREALALPGEARRDLDIIVAMARELGLDWRYTHPSQVFDEMRKAMPSIAGITWDRLERESAVTYPCEKVGDPGERVVFIDDFPTPSGRARLVPAQIIPAAERPDEQYPFVLITGRQLEHWHTGSMTRRSEALDAIEPYPVASVNSRDLAALGVAPGGAITVASRRGSVFIPFCYYEAAANLLTNPALDPFGKIPEFKYCAVSLSAGGTPAATPGYGERQAMAAD
jgi:formate dehydrogenase major subunit